MHMKEKVGVGRLGVIGFWRIFTTITKNLGLERRNQKILTRGMTNTDVQIS